MTQLVEESVQSEAVANAGKQIVVLRLGEITLKKKNRPMFVRQLARNVRRATRDLGVEGIALMPNRILVTPGPQTDWPELRDRLRRVFGVKNFSLCQGLPWDVDVIQTEVLKMAAARLFASFRIEVRRSDKRFPGTSQELEVSLGRAVQLQSGARVDLERPEVSFNVEIQPGAAYLHDERIAGAAGLPAGVSGRVVVLLSGGIDSPVAAWRMIGRGCNATFVHFMSFPYLDASSRDKAIALVRSLTRWQYESRLHVVSFGDVQHQIVASCPPKLRVVLYRRFMVRIAEAIAKREHAGALVTGESMGQVASQTLSNIATIDAAVSMPVLRPLIGRDKDEIIEEARRIETYEISIEPDQDCCSLFVPAHPATSSRLDDVEAAEQALDVDALVAQALEHTEKLTFSWPERGSVVQTVETRYAVAIAVTRHDGLVLAVQRPDEPGEELPGVWGLPATTLRDGESPEDGVRRLGREKLGVVLTPQRALAEGEQQRSDYTLHMTVYEASMAGEPRLAGRGASTAGTLYDALDWLPAASFADAAARGSLCCELFVASLTPDPSPASGRGELRREGWRPREWISSELRQRMVEAARGFRKAPTRSEAILWQAIRDRKVAGLKFRRQHPVGPFVVDFCCTERLLIVEVDGPIHESQEQRDRDRQELLEAAGYRVLRVPSEDMERDVRPVVARIRALAEELNP